VLRFCVPEVYELWRRRSLGLWLLYELKTMSGLRIPSAEECLRREFQSGLGDKLPCLSDIVKVEVVNVKWWTDWKYMGEGAGAGKRKRLTGGI